MAYVMSYVWKILDVYSDGGTITSVKYFCSLTNGKDTIETEGYWGFPNGEAEIPFAEVTEEMIVGWIVESSTVNDENIIKSRLEQQLLSLKNKPVPAPWLPQVFTPEL